MAMEVADAESKLALEMKQLLQSEKDAMHECLTQLQYELVWPGPCLMQAAGQVTMLQQHHAADLLIYTIC